MNGKNRSRPRRDPFGDRCRIDVAFWADVGQHRGAPKVQNRVHRGAKSQWSSNDLIPGTNPEGGERKVESRSSRAQRQGAARSGVGLKLALEPGGSLAGGKPTAA